MRPNTRVAVLVAALALGLTACGGDGAADSSASGSASSSGSGSASGVEGAEAPCAPVGEGLEAEAATTLDVQLTDYAFEPAELETQAGVVTFATTNAGDQAHELAFLPGGGEVPFTEEGAPDEDALAEAGAFELEAYGPGQSCDATYVIEPGTYTIFCIVEAPDGETHYEKGMVGTVTAS